MIALADCAVAVADAEEAARWWTEKLGFTAHTVGTGTHAVMVAPPGDRFVLHLCEGFEAVQPGNSGIAFVTDDLEGMVGRMEASGVQFAEPLKKEPWGGMAKFADPDGNIYWLLGAPTSFIRKESARRAPSGRRPSRRSAGPKTLRRGKRARR
jgi:catechol 2,3-dioxygenase-like lactoylglutathione lyase family enzyme